MFKMPIFNMKGVLKPSTTAHLRRVYLFLALSVLSSSFGCVIGSIIKRFYFFFLFANIGLLIAFNILSFKRVSYKIRSLIALLFCFSLGWGVSPVTFEFGSNNRNLLLLALFGTSGIFASLSMSAIFAKRRNYLFLGSILGVLFMSFSITQIFQVFFKSAIADAWIIYGGLAFFAMSVLHETQLMIERCEANLPVDPISDAIQQFMNFFGIFIRIVIHFLKNAEKNRENERESSRRKNKKSQ